ncbi:kelch-like protein 42 [Branchiostoma floridae]|uniref:Kelch-like protein 42 n=1 Tax=Branchiostoma floridae TaxID=7739 RepID=A0A9J7L9Z9_BRAFL|nr:kelch-like protein 42 [Branchiostoma floridae]XP_035678952.1 kelch-like protein 42 [Branchiostoma floridae]XP_035678959.1 kelch-like protein 42 [Branchiostoma floridae]
MLTLSALEWAAGWTNDVAAATQRELDSIMDQDVQEKKRKKTSGGGYDVCFFFVNEESDITVCVEETSFLVHRRVLEESSDYFRAMFECDMMESRQSEVQLHDFRAEIFETVLDFLYTSEFCLDYGNLEEVLEMANFLQVLPLLDHIAGLVDEKNCVTLFIMADKYSISKVTDVTGKILSDNYHRYLQSKELSRLTKEQRERVRQKRYHHKPVVAAVNAHYVHYPEPGLRQFHSYDDKNDAWSRFTRLPNTASRRGFGVAVLDNYLFVVGGHAKPRDYPRQFHSTGTKLGALQNQTVCYNTLTDTWFNTAPIQQARAYFGLVPCGDFIYAIAGFQYDDPIHSVERYDPRDNSWVFVRDVPEGRTCYEPAVTCMGDIYVNCEIKDSDTFWLHKYSPASNTWTAISELPTNRWRHCMAAVQDTVYILGAYQPGVDCFNVSSQQWFRVRIPRDLKIPYDRGCASLGDDVYVLDCEETLCHNVKTRKWTDQLCQFPLGGFGIKAVTLYLPERKARDDGGDSESD